MAAIVINNEQATMVKSWENATNSIKDLTDFLRSQHIVIPPWQREFTWSIPLQQMLVACIMKNDPMPQILLRQLPNLHYSLEDGRQRLTSLKNYRDNMYPVNGKKFTEMTSEEQKQFLSYRMPTQTYRGFTDEEAVQLFINRQQGVSLSNGEKYYAVDSFSPLVRVTRNLLMKADSGLHNDAAAVWGRLCDDTSADGIVTTVKDKKRRNLERACALVAGLAWGIEWITKKWSDISTINPKVGHTMMTRPIHNDGETEQEAQERIRLKLVEILEIYKAVQSKHKVTLIHLKKQFDPGFATGYIMYGMSLPSDRMPPQFKEKWVDFLVEERKNAAAARALKRKFVSDLSKDEIVGSARTWSKTRWENGHNHLFSPSSVLTHTVPLENEDRDDEDEENDSEDDEDSE